MGVMVTKSPLCPCKGRKDNGGAPRRIRWWSVPRFSLMQVSPLFALLTHRNEKVVRGSRGSAGLVKSPSCPYKGRKDKDGAPRQTHGPSTVRLLAHSARGDIGGRFASGGGIIGRRSDQRIRPVACITANRVTIEMMVIASPVKPFQKNA